MFRELKIKIDRSGLNDRMEYFHNHNEFLSTSYKITDKFQPATHEIDVDLQFVIAFIDTYIQLISAEKEEYSKYLNYQPPLPDKDIPVLIQSFLI